ncbi:uncharacterized protein LOC126750720 isoform X2 [Anthonomus grandis grandis]|uniref:uncharacterized protein LOC126750720 isoform X2 n=1 Tax=Anthonomus grandis grandis TaxID=2921223 RepID=UPI002165E97A|nr:uncharacterized protein LOC126750720 isoform X2 [Anthonomus grandis grandis]
MSEIKKLRFVIWVCMVCSTSEVEINYVKVPNAVKNDTNRPVILDCNYSIRPDDTDLVVQWFLNEELVYQWIPPNKPQSIGMLKNAVDLNYTATDDPTTVYRAVKILNPTTQLAGEYRCLVSTLGDHDSRMKNMIVFEKQIFISKASDEKFVNFTCTVSDVYPAPKMVLFKDVQNDIHSRMRLSIIEWDLKKNPITERYSMSIVGTHKLNELDPGTLIHCELKIPGTGYVKLKSLLYYPEYNSENGSGRNCGVIEVLVTLALNMLVYDFIYLKHLQCSHV